MRVVGFLSDPVFKRNQSHGLSRLKNSPLLHSFSTVFLHFARFFSDDSRCLGDWGPRHPKFLLSALWQPQKPRKPTTAIVVPTPWQPKKFTPRGTAGRVCFFDSLKHGRCSVSCINGLLLVSGRFLFFWGGACWCFHFKDLKIVNLPFFLSLSVASRPAQWSNGPVSIGNLQTVDSPLLDCLKATVI